MKNFIIISLFLWTSLANAAAPYGLKGQSQTQTIYPNVHQFPNKQVTPTGGINALVENGNTNEFENSGFEHSTITTGWTITGATSTANTSSPLDGKQSLRITATGTTVSIIQDSTINAAQQGGVQKTCSVNVSSTTMTGIQLCARVNGVTQSNLCTAVGGYNIGTGKKPLAVSFQGGATSSGCELKTTTATIGNVSDIDTFKMGDGAPIVDFGGGEFLGKVTYTAATGCYWNTSSTTWSSFSADNDCVSGVASGTSLVSAPGTKIPAAVISNYRAGTYMFQVIAYGGVNTASLTGGGALRLSDGTRTTAEMLASIHTVSNTSAPNSTTLVGTIINPTDSTNVTVQMQGYTSNASNPFGIAAASSNNFEIAIYYFPSKTSQAYVASSSDFGPRSETYTLTNAGNATVSGTVERKGVNAIFKGRITIGSSLPTGSIALNLPSGYTLSTTGGYLQSSIGAFVAGNFVNGLAANPTTTAIQFYGPNTSAAWSATVPATWANTNYIDFAITAQIPGWTDPGVVVASFAGIASTPGITTEKREDFIFSYGTTNSITACTASPCSYLDQIGNGVSSITRSGTGLYNIIFNRTYSKIKCTMNLSLNSGDSATKGATGCSNCSSVSFSSTSDSYGTIDCKGTY